MSDGESSTIKERVAVETHPLASGEENATRDMLENNQV